MKSLLRRKLRAGISLPALILVSGVLGASSAANAQSANDAEVKALRAQVEALQKAVNQLTSGQQQSSADAKAAKQQADEAKAKAAQAASDTAKLQKATANANAALIPAKAAAASDLEIDAQGHTFLQKKKGNPLTFYTPGGEITAYGNFDVSVDGTSKDVRTLDLHGATGPDAGPVGNFGWLPAISSNSSYLGVRGFQRVPNLPLNFIYQVELGFDISATPGLRQTNSNLSDTVNGTLFNRNTWVGFANPEFGAIKIGKTNAPYDSSTGGFNPFQNQIGDMRVVMGNTGGDNRVEFSTRLDHSIWYESPTINGFQFNALFSPGQNRSDISDNIPAGSSDCGGGNDPLSGGLAPQGCNDGGFSNAVSTNLSYTNGGFYGTVAYERHFKVNRQSDISGLYTACNIGQSFTDCVNQPFVPGGAAGSFGNATQLNAFLADVADEDAFKVAALYTFPTKTTVGGIFEVMHRYVSPLIQFQNERTRNGSWLFLTQELTQEDSVSFGWAHAFKANGDPGQHNSATTAIPLPGTSDPTTCGNACGATTASNENQADMVTATYKRKFGPNLTWYTAVAATFNGTNAHYDLGAGGHGVTTDCHDAFAASGGSSAITHCFVGTTLAGVSTGIQWRF